MTDPLTNPDSLEPSTGFTAAPSVAQAANDLRAAAGDKAKDLAHSIGTQAAAIKDRAIESAQHLREAATEKAEALRIAAAERAHRLQESAVEQWSHTCETGKDIQITAEDYIRQNPTKCVFGALGLGILIGLMVRR